MAAPHTSLPVAASACRPNAASASHGRIALIDGLKALLIVLVVIGHFMHPVHNANPAASALFDIIYLFHMPLFVFLSGLFAKGAYRDGRLNTDRVISYVVLGVLYQVAILVINGDPVFSRELLWFSSAPWYLIAMVWWYTLTPLLHRLGPKRGMAASIAAALLWGVVDLSSGFMAISRAVAFLPWFALGYYLTPQAVVRLRERHRGLVFAAAMAAGAFVTARLLYPRAYDFFFPQVYGDTPYLAGVAFGMLQKLVAAVVALVLSVTVVGLMPAQPSRLITTLGRRTLQVYVLHRLLRAALTFRTGFYDLPILLDPAWGLAIMLGLSAVVVCVCGAAPVEGAFARLIRFPWTAAFERFARVSALFPRLVWAKLFRLQDAR